MIEVMCYPFAGLGFYEQDSIEQHYKTDKNQFNTKNITETLENTIKSKYHIHNLDILDMLVRKYYFFSEKQYHNAEEYSLDMFSKLAKSFISQRDGKFVYKYWENEQDKELLGGFAGHNKIIFFHALNRHIPLDIIVVQYLLDNANYSKEHNIEYINYLKGFYGLIHMGDMQLDGLLQKGISENHIHVGAYGSFPLFWDSFMKQLYAKNKQGFLNLRLKEEDFTLILTANILRLVLSIWIKYEEINSSEKSNETYKELFQIICNIKSNVQNCKQDITSEKERQNAIYSFFVSLWEEIENNYFVSKNDEYNYNYIDNIFKTKHINTTREAIFLFYALEKIQNKKQNKYFRKIFFQYIRIKHHIFNIYVQENTITGLQYFQRYYGKNSKAGNFIKNIEEKDYWEIVIREQFQNKYLEKIEFRLSVKDSDKDLFKDIVAFLSAYQKILHESYCIKKEEEYVPYKRLPRVGIIFHFIKNEDTEISSKCFYEACDYLKKEEEGYHSFLYYGNLQKKYQQQLEQVKEMRIKYPILSKYIVGIDAASLENATPIQIFAPIFENARDSSCEPIFIQKDGIECSLQSLCFTFHAGEDFRHLLSGLRRIYEVVHYCKFHAGDRIGHGIALGLSAEFWQKRNPVVILPQMELLENYIWAFDLLRNSENEVTKQLFYLEEKIEQLSEKIYGSIINISTLIRAYKKEFKKSLMNIDYENKELKEKFCKNMPNNTILWNEKKLYYAKHCQYYLNRMVKPIHIEITQQDVEIIKNVQIILEEYLGQAGIVIEINPSSNVVIGEMDSLFDHHSYTINHFMDAKNNVMICVNTDDPSLFNTNISNELCYIYYGLMEKKCNKELALNWIEKLRKNGIECSFIRNNLTDKEMLEELEELLKQLKGEI